MKVLLECLAFAVTGILIVYAVGWLSDSLIVYMRW